MKSRLCLLLLLVTVIAGANGCFSRTAENRQPEPRVLPVKIPPPQPVEEVVEMVSVSKQAAVPSRGSSSGSRPTTRTNITPSQLRTLSEQLLTQDVNNVGHLLQLNYQGKTSSRARDDKAQLPLFRTVPAEALSGNTVSAMLNLLDNYDPLVTVKETTSKVEEQEKNTFLDAVMSTQIMATTEQFLKGKGLIKRSLREVLDEIWFDLYGRSGRNPGSSGFEHTFIGEVKNGKVSGFHNWVTFIHEEQDQDLDYKGFMKYVKLGNKGQIVSARFSWLNNQKPITSMFVGTSPELEMALYTICFYTRPSNKCPMQLNKKRFNIQTYPYKVGAKTLVGSAFPMV